MQPLQYDLWSPAAKDNSITHAAKRGSNTCNPIYIAGTILQLQSAMEFHRQLIHQQHLQSHLHCGKDPTVANHNGISSATHPGAPLAIPFTLRERSYSCKSQWNSIDNSSSSTTCNPIYIAGTILQLQITMEFCRPHMHVQQLKHHLQCGTDPRPIRTWSEHDPTTHETVSQPSHRRGRSSRFGDGLCMEKHRVSCICYLAKTHFVRDFLQNSIGNSSTSTTCHLHCGKHPTVANHNGIPSTTHPAAPLAIPFTLRERSYSCKSQWNSVDRTLCTKNSWNPIYNAEPIRDRSEHDPNMIRPHTRPSRNRRTAEVDHRGSGTDFVWKNIGFRASAISQKRISCETSSKTPSATPPPAPLAMPFTVREQSYCFFD